MLVGVHPAFCENLDVQQGTIRRSSDSIATSCPLLRIELPGTLYHVTSRGDGRDDIRPLRRHRLAGLPWGVRRCVRALQLVGGEQGQESRVSVIRDGTSRAPCTTRTISTPSVIRRYRMRYRRTGKRHDPSRACGVGILRSNEPPPGLGLDRRHVGMTSRTTGQAICPEAPKHGR
jgi:hypothetical protein